VVDISLGECRVRTKRTKRRRTVYEGLVDLSRGISPSGKGGRKSVTGGRASIRWHLGCDFSGRGKKKEMKAEGKEKWGRDDSWGLFTRKREGWPGLYDVGFERL